MVFKPGEVANPHGGKKKSSKVAGMAREHTEAAVQALIKALASEDENVTIKAANSLLDRGWGKPQEYVEHSGDEENPIRQKIEVLLVRANPDTGSV